MQPPQSPVLPSDPRRTNVFPLRRDCPPAETTRDRTPRAMTLDLQTQIDSLRSLKSDLEAYYWDHTGSREGARVERDQITYWIRQIADRTAALEALVMHKGSSRLVVSGVTPTEEEALHAAAAVLDQWIPEDESFKHVLRTVTAVLRATDRIGLRAAGGMPPVGDPDRR